MYKVFLNERVVFIGGGNNKTLFNNQPKNTYSEHYVGHDGYIDMDEFDSVSEVQTVTDFASVWQSFVANEYWKKIFLYSDTTDKLFSILFSFFIRLDAAGGVVLDKNNRLLCIKRFGKWDLPKGKVEKGESFRLAAMREVKEETGIDAIANEKPHIITHHVYQSPYHNNEWVLKPTYWYRMKCINSENLVPQSEESITDVKWFGEELKDEVIQNTYKSLIDVIQLAYK
ncbi:MAG: NUDIX domain-containing protein [Prolixibacteraceae bacterium]|nr:NUDIX domain-containing protein [Prolixibacteraceae bacterium]